MKRPAKDYGLPGDVDLGVIRLLRSAARADVDLAPEMPFGFDTRVVALTRGDGLTNGNGISRLLRRVAFAAVVIIITAAAATLHEVAQASEFDGPMTNEYAIADAAIQSQLQR